MNIIHLWPNLTRAFEIGKSLGWTIKVVADQNTYPNALDDFKAIREFYGDESFSEQGELTVEIYPPDLRKEYSNYKMKISPIDIPHYLPVDNTSKTLLAKAIEKLDLSANETEKIRKVATGIAAYQGHKTVKADDMAEAIHYSDSVIKHENIICVLNGKISFGKGITIDPFQIEKEDIDSVINYLNNLKQ